MGTFYAPQVVVREFRPPQTSKKNAEAAQPTLRGYKTEPNLYHDCADFVLMQICEEEDCWANRDVTWEVPIRELIPMNHPIGRAVRKAFSAFPRKEI